MPNMTLVLLAPILTGVLWLWMVRRDRRRQFIENRLAALHAGVAGVADAPKLQREPTTYFFRLPTDLRERLDAMFATTGNNIGVLHLIAAALIGAAIAMLFTSRVLQLGSPLVVSIACMAAAATPFAVFSIARSRYQRRFLDVFPDALDLVRRSIKAGLPINEALHAAGREIGDPIGEQLREAFGQVQLGTPMIAALERIANRIRIPDFQFMVVALALQEKTGGSLAETLGNLSNVIRGRKGLRLKARALSSEAKASAAVLSVIPFVVAGAMSVLNPDLSHMLFVDPRGYRMLGVAMLSLLFGLGTMYVIVKRALR